MATTKKSKRPAAAAKSANGQGTLHKLFLAGIGLADETNTKFQQAFDALVKKGEAHEPEVKKAIDDIRTNAVAKGKELEKKFYDAVKQSEMVKSKRFQDLIKKVEDLEVKVRGKVKAKTVTKSKAKPAAKKS